VELTDNGNQSNARRVFPAAKARFAYLAPSFPVSLPLLNLTRSKPNELDNNQTQKAILFQRSHCGNSSTTSRTQH
jgi:hypothetical protein